MIFWRSSLKDKFAIKLYIIAVRALRQGEGQIKNGFQSDFLGPYDIPHGNKSQAKLNFDLKMLCTAILLHDNFTTDTDAHSSGYGDHMVNLNFG